MINPTRQQDKVINSGLRGAFSSSKKKSIYSNYGRRFLLVISLAGLYFAAARLGLSLASVHTTVSPVWPPTGIAIAAVLLLGYRAWPGIFLGAVLADRGLQWAGGLAKERYLGAFLVVSVVFGAAVATFGKSGPAPLPLSPLTRLIVPFFRWAAFRLGHRGVALATMTLSVFAGL